MTIDELLATLEEPKYQRPVCRGCERLGSACGTCERCVWRRKSEAAARTALPAALRTLRRIRESMTICAANDAIDAFERGEA